MRIGHFADTHLGFQRWGYPDEDGFNQRETDIYKVFNEAIEQMLDRKVEAVIHAGDLFENHHPPTRAIEVALDGLKRLINAGIPVVAVPGNHSTPRNPMAAHVFGLLERFGVKTIRGGPGQVRVGDFLAADSHLARMVINAVAHQYLVPAVQLGTSIEVDKATGAVGDIRTNVRLILPGTGCLRCNKLVSGARVQEESLGAVERERNRYLDEVPAPSVITFNAWAAAQAANDFMLMLGQLIGPDAPMDYLRCRPRGRVSEPVRPLPNRIACPDCGTGELSRRARGDGAELPLPQRS